MTESLTCCQQAAAARDGDTEAAALADKLGESAGRILELEEILTQAQRVCQGLYTEVAGLRARAAQLEQEVSYCAAGAKSLFLKLLLFKTWVVFLVEVFH